MADELERIDRELMELRRDVRIIANAELKLNLAQAKMHNSLVKILDALEIIIDGSVPKVVSLGLKAGAPE
jgi:hypothetical protein